MLVFFLFAFVFSVDYIRGILHSDLLACRCFPALCLACDMHEAGAAIGCCIAMPRIC